MPKKTGVIKKNLNRRFLFAVSNMYTLNQWLKKKKNVPSHGMIP